MTDKEKLFELIGKVQDCGCDVTDVVEMNYVENNVLVDHLIANGVTIQKRAYWKRFKHPSGTHGIRCSNCNIMDGRRAPFCRNCGAKMDLEN